MARPKRRFGPGSPDDVSVRLTRGDVSLERDPGSTDEQQFLREVAKMGVDVSDLDRPLEDLVDELGAIECMALAEAVWGVELGPRSGTVSEMGEMAYDWPTLRALIEAAKAKSGAPE